MEDPCKLRELARWYREFAERTGNPDIWHARLITAKDLEREPIAWKRWRPGATRDRATGPLSMTEDRLTDGSS